jgi:hypothetical protein
MESHQEQFERHRSLLQPRRHWLGLPVVQQAGETLNEIVNALPQFGRQPFAMASVNGDEVGVNSFLDMVYRIATHQGERAIPVGVVSKNYRLVDHHQVLRTIQQALMDNDLDLEALKVHAQWTVHGERAHFSILFPPEERFTLDLASKEDQMRFRIEVFNSVDGSCRLMSVAGWLRLVCSNGLIIGTALMQLQQQHRQQLQVEELGRLVREVIRSAGIDKETLESWLSTPIETDALVRWVDEDVHTRWGTKAAVRVLGIAKSGCDVETVGNMKNQRPSEIGTRTLGRVPGLDGPVTNIFGISQVLSWIAGQRAELAEDFEWRSQVQDLMEKLTR